MGGSGFRFWFWFSSASQRTFRNFRVHRGLVSNFRVQNYYILHKDTIFSCDNYVTICFSHVKVTQNYYFLNDISTRFVEKCTFHVSFSILMPIAYLLYNVYSIYAPCGAWTDNNYSLKLIKLRKFPILPILKFYQELERFVEDPLTTGKKLEIFFFLNLCEFEKGRLRSFFLGTKISDDDQKICFRKLYFRTQRR